MERPLLQTVSRASIWTCRRCQARRQRSGIDLLQSSTWHRPFSSSPRPRADVEIQAAPELDFRNIDTQPARILPTSPSYFTGSPMFTDDILLLRSLTKQYEKLPTLPADQVPRITWMKLAQYRSSVGEVIAAGRYARILDLLKGLNRIPADLRPSKLVSVLERFRRPGTAEAPRPRPVVIDEYGRAKAVGRRKASSARVHLVEGSGEVLVNGKSIVDVFSRLHDRESALWPLKISQRMDKYNVFAVVTGGGTTGQAEAITLAIAKAILVHEPALKPLLRRAGCITRDPRRVERKKPGHVKARKMPTWVKR